MSRPWLLLALFGLLVVVGAAGYRQGHKAATTQAQAEQAAHLRNAIAEQAAHLRNAIAEAEAIAAQDREIYAAGDARVARVDTVFRTIDREVVRYVHTHPLATDCLDADGLRLWAAANAGDVEDAAGDSGDAGPLPGDAAGTEGRDRPGAAGGSRGAGAPVSPATGRGADLGGLDAGSVARTQPPHWGFR